MIYRFKKGEHYGIQKQRMGRKKVCYFTKK